MGVANWKRGLYAKIIIAGLSFGIGMILFMVFPMKLSSSTKPPEPIVFIEGNIEIADKLYETWKKEKEKKRTQPQGAIGFNSKSCVFYVERRLGIDLPRIDYARNLKTNSSWPSVGAIIKTDESYAGHLAVITAIDGNILTIWESNWIPNTEGTRKLSIDSSQILGYFEPR